MAQTRYWNFKQDDKTSFLNRWLNGIFQPGRYRGYDFNPTADLNLNLVHTTTGFTDVDEDEVEVANQAKVITRQGTIVVEDAAITLPISAGDGSNPRIDVVVLTHEYVALAGGQQATYSVIEGTPAASPVAPSLTDTLRQVKIGELLVPTGMSQLDDVGVVWTQERSPSVADETYTADRALKTDSSGLIVVSSTTAAQIDVLSSLTDDRVVGRSAGLLISLNTTHAEINAINGLAANRALETDGSGLITASVITATELNYLDGVTSNIQTQLNGKEPTITGGATTITSSNLTADRALISNGSGKVAVAAVTATELGYLDGVERSIATLSWTSVTFSGTWGGTLEYAIDAMNIVHLRGRISTDGSAGGSGLTVANLPAGYRPDQEYVYPLIQNPGQGIQNFNIETDGDFRAHTTYGTISNGTEYRTEQFHITWPAA